MAKSLDTTVDVALNLHVSFKRLKEIRDVIRDRMHKLKLMNRKPNIGNLANTKIQQICAEIIMRFPTEFEPLNDEQRGTLIRGLIRKEKRAYKRKEYPLPSSSGQPRAIISTEEFIRQSSRSSEESGGENEPDQHKHADARNASLCERIHVGPTPLLTTKLYSKDKPNDAETIIILVSGSDLRESTSTEPKVVRAIKDGYNNVQIMWGVCALPA